VRTVTPLRAVFVNENIGGHTTVHAALRRCFAERTDVQAEFLDAPAPGRLGRVLRAPAPGLSRFDADLQPLRAQLVRSEWVRRALRERLRQGGVDAVHVYTQNCALTSAGLLRTVPTVITTDSTTVLNAYRIPYRAPARFTPWSVRASVPLERQALHTAYRVIANSRYAADSLRTHYGVPAGALEVLAFGVWLPSEATPRTDAATRRRLHRPPAGTQGGPPPHRVAPAAPARAVRPGAHHLRAGGAAARGAGGVRDQRRQRPAVGGAAEVDIMCFPSTIDQAPNAVLEAAAAGLPVIAHPVGAIAEMVQHGVTGLLVPPDDPAALCAALTSLLDDPARARQLGRAGRAHVPPTTTCGPRLLGWWRCWVRRWPNALRRRGGRR